MVLRGVASRWDLGVQLGAGVYRSCVPLGLRGIWFFGGCVPAALGCSLKGEIYFLRLISAMFLILLRSRKASMVSKCSMIR